MFKEKFWQNTVTYSLRVYEQENGHIFSQEDHDNINWNRKYRTRSSFVVSKIISVWKLIFEEHGF